MGDPWTLAFETFEQKREEARRQSEALDTTPSGLAQRNYKWSAQAAQKHVANERARKAYEPKYKAIQEAITRDGKPEPGYTPTAGTITNPLPWADYPSDDAPSDDPRRELYYYRPPGTAEETPASRSKVHHDLRNKYKDRINQHHDGSDLGFDLYGGWFPGLSRGDVTSITEGSDEITPQGERKTFASDPNIAEEFLHKSWRVPLRLGQTLAHTGEKIAANVYLKDPDGPWTPDNELPTMPLEAWAERFAKWAQIDDIGNTWTGDSKAEDFKSATDNPLTEGAINFPRSLVGLALAPFQLIHHAGTALGDFERTPEDLADDTLGATGHMARYHVEAVKDPLKLWQDDPAGLMAVGLWARHALQSKLRTWQAENAGLAPDFPLGDTHGGAYRTAIADRNRIHGEIVRGETATVAENASLGRVDARSGQGQSSGAQRLKDRDGQMREHLADVRKHLDDGEIGSAQHAIARAEALAQQMDSAQPSAPQHTPAPNPRQLDAAAIDAIATQLEARGTAAAKTSTAGSTHSATWRELVDIRDQLNALDTELRVRPHDQATGDFAAATRRGDRTLSHPERTSQAALVTRAEQLAARLEAMDPEGIGQNGKMAVDVLRLEAQEARIRALVATDGRFDIASIAASMGTAPWMVPFDALAIYARRHLIDNPNAAGQRWMWLEQAKRIPAMFRNITRETRGTARRFDMVLHDLVNKLAKENPDALPTVREFMHMEHSPIFDKVHGRNLVEFDPGSASWGLSREGRAKWGQNGIDALKRAVENGTIERIHGRQDALLAAQVVEKTLLVNDLGRPLAQRALILARQSAKNGMVLDPTTALRLFWPEVYGAPVPKPGLLTRARDALTHRNRPDRTGGTERLPMQVEGTRMMENTRRSGNTHIETAERRHGMSRDIKAEADAMADWSYQVQQTAAKNRLAREGAGEYVLTAREHADLMARHPERRGHYEQLPDEPMNPAIDRRARELGIPKEQVPKKHGDLSGKWVDADIVHELLNLEKVRAQAHTWPSRAVRLWKGMQTVAAPVTTFRNLLSNVLVFAPAMGMSIWDPRNARFFYEAIRDVMRHPDRKSRKHKRIIKDGYLDGTWYGSEVNNRMASSMRGALGSAAGPLNGFLDLFNELISGKTRHGQAISKAQALSPTRIPRAAKRAVGEIWDTIGDFYGALDDVFRTAFAYKLESHGHKALKGTAFDDLYKQHKQSQTPLTRQQKVDLVRNGFIDYEAVPGWVQVLRQPYNPVHWARAGKSATPIFYAAGQPFMAFTARAIPLIQRWLRQAPGRANLLLSLHESLNASFAGEAMFGPDATQQQEQDALEYARTRERDRPFWERTRAVAGLAFHPALWGVGDTGLGDMRTHDGVKDPEYWFAYLGALMPFDIALHPDDEGYSLDQKLLHYLGQFAGNPITTPILETLFNEKLYFGGDVYDQKSTIPGHAAAKSIEHVIQSWLSPLTPSLTDTAETVGDAISGLGDIFGLDIPKASDTTRPREGERYEGDRELPPEIVEPGWLRRIGLPDEPATRIDGGRFYRKLHAWFNQEPDYRGTRVTGRQLTAEFFGIKGRPDSDVMATLRHARNFTRELPSLERDVDNTIGITRSMARGINTDAKQDPELTAIRDAEKMKRAVPRVRRLLANINPFAERLKGAKRDTRIPFAFEMREYARVFIDAHPTDRPAALAALTKMIDESLQEARRLAEYHHNLGAPTPRSAP